MKHVVVIEITTHLFSDFSPIVRLAGWQRVLSKNWFGKLFLLKPETRHRSFLKVHNKILTSFKVRTAQWCRSNFLFQDSTSVEKETFKKHIGHLIGCSKKKGNVDNEMIIVFFSGTFVFSRKCLSTYCYIIWENLIVTMKFIVLPDHPASENPCPKVFYCSTFLLGQRPSNCLVETHTHITHIFNKKHMFVPS